MARASDSVQVEIDPEYLNDAMTKAVARALVEVKYRLESEIAREIESAVVSTMRTQLARAAKAAIKEQLAK